MAVSVRSIAQASAVGDVTLNLASDTAVGDFLVVTQTWFGDNVSNMTTPTPGTWSVAATGDSGNGAQAVRVWVRFATAAGAQSITVPGQPGGGSQARCRVWIGVDTTTPVAAGAGAGANGFGSPTAPSVTGVDGGGLCCDYVVDDPRTFSAPPPGMTASGTQMDNPWTGYGAHQVLSATGATGTKTPTISASASYAASSVVVSPAAGSTLAVTEAPDTLAASGTVTPPTTPYKVADRGSAQNLTSSTTTAVDLPAAGSIAVGNVLIARLAIDNSGLNGAATTVVITDPRSNTWTVGAAANQDPGAANAGISCRIAYCVVVNAYTNGDDLTITYGDNTPADATVVEEWANLNVAPLVAVAQTIAAGASATPSISRTPTAAGQLFYGALGIEGPAGDTYTQDSDTTDGIWSTLTSLSTTSGTAASNATIRGASKLVTGTAAQTWNPGITSRDWAMVALVFNPASTPIAGSLARMEAPDTLAAAGTSTSPSSTGSLAETEQNDQVAASGTVTTPPVTGSLAQTEAPDTLAAAGVFTPAPVTGSLSETEAADTLSAAGIVEPPLFAGSLAVTEAPDALAAAGTYTPPGRTGTVAFTEEDDVLTATGAVVAPIFSGALSVTEEDDTLVASGTRTVPDITGTLDVTEENDLLVATGTVVNPLATGSLNVTEENDTLAATGAFVQTNVTGSLVVTEQDDTLAATGTVTTSVNTGVLNVTEQDDALLASGIVTPPAIIGALSVIEESDVLSGVGTVTGPLVMGSLTVTEESDALSATGSVVTENVTGSLNVTEEDDTLAAVGTVVSTNIPQPPVNRTVYVGLDERTVRPQSRGVVSPAGDRRVTRVWPR